MYYCYILQSFKNYSYYIGSTSDRASRLKLHNSSQVRSTKHAILWKLIYSESFATLKEARTREIQIKNWKSRAAIERLINKI